MIEKNLRLYKSLKITSFSKVVSQLADKKHRHVNWETNAKNVTALLASY